MTDIHLNDRFEALQEALELATGRVDEQQLHQAKLVIERAGERRKYSAEHTVVAFVGATGSGKSSLLNAIAGETIARSAVTRPTTSQPLALTWGADNADELLDWLQVGERHEMGYDEKYKDLILLDLPDFDSTNTANKALVDQLVGMVDVIVWVMDPQKYADAVIHHQYIQPWSHHGSLTLAVLNQIDRVPENQREGVLVSVAKLLHDDGLNQVNVLPVSALKGDGIAELKEQLAKIANEHQGAVQRWVADIRNSSQHILGDLGTADTSVITPRMREDLAHYLGKAAGVERISQAVGEKYALDAKKKTGWPLTRWLNKVKPDPLRAIGLSKKTIDPKLMRTSLTTLGASQKATTHNALRAFVDQSSAGLPERWKAKVQQAGMIEEPQLVDALDQAIAHTPLHREKNPWWWNISDAVQWTGLLIALLGFLWLIVISLFEFFQLGSLFVPHVYNIPLPTVLLFSGVLLGLVWALGARIFAGLGAKRAQRKVVKALEVSIAQRTHDAVINPVTTELERFEKCRQKLRVASA